MKTSDFAFDLPEHLIAQTPVTPRDHSRLLCCDRASGLTEHRHFYDLPRLLRAGDLLVANDSRVLPARLYGERPDTGGALEMLLLEERERGVWEVLVRPGKRAKDGARFVFGGGLLEAEILEHVEGGNRLARFSHDGDFYAVLEAVGQMPLPPYITRQLEEKERYQTVYARERGSAAAPTAGLHFTPELMERIRGMGVGIEYVTLHVGLGTFRPVKVEDVAHHHMHTERYTVPVRTAEAIARTKAEGGRVIAVGTTTARTLESVCRSHGEVVPESGSTDIFIYPGFRFQVLDGLITNFHLPESTLIMLVSAFLGYEKTMTAYREAVQEQYRFFSFGDAMFIG